MLKKFTFLGFAALILVLDQLSKWAVTQHMIRPALGDSQISGFIDWMITSAPKLPFTQIEILPFFNIVMVWNEGVSFGMLPGFGPWLLVGLSAVITIWFIIWLFMTNDLVQKLAIAMVIGGAIGNAVDRLRFGAVVDFLDFHAFGYHYPAFNLADSCIVLGVLILMIHALFFEKRFPEQP